MEHGSDEAFLPHFLSLRALTELLDGDAAAAGASIAAAITRAPGRRGYLDLRAGILAAQGRTDAAARARSDAVATPLQPSPLDLDYPMADALRLKLEW